MTPIQLVQTAGSAPPRGHYSPAVVHAGLVYVSGQLPVDPVTGSIPEDFEAQAAQVMRNVEAALEAAGSGLDRLLQVTVFVTDLAHWPVFNQVYAQMLGDHKPSRAVVPVGPLHGGALIEVMAVGAVR